MATPGKTSETLNLAEVMNSNPSASGSKDGNTANLTKPKDDILNANVVDCITMHLNDIDLSFSRKVVTQESSSDFMVHEDHNHNDTVPASVGAQSGVAAVDESNLTILTPNNDKDWKADVGNVYNRVLEMQKSGPKKYAADTFTKQRTIIEEPHQVKPEVVSCPKCGRKIAAGAINRHMQFCVPENTQGQESK